jgi:hypothetical protein
MREDEEESEEGGEVVIPRLPSMVSTESACTIPLSLVESSFSTSDG